MISLCCYCCCFFFQIIFLNNPLCAPILVVFIIYVYGCDRKAWPCWFVCLNFEFVVHTSAFCGNACRGLAWCLMLSIDSKRKRFWKTEFLQNRGWIGQKVIKCSLQLDFEIAVNWQRSLRIHLSKQVGPAFWLPWRLLGINKLQPIPIQCSSMHDPSTQLLL